MGLPTVQFNSFIGATDRYKAFIRMSAALQEIKVSSQEVKVLDEIFWTAQGALTLENRKQVAANLKITEFNLNNYIMKLRRKKFIDENNKIADRYMINSITPTTNFAMLFVLQS